MHAIYDWTVSNKCTWGRGLVGDFSICMFRDCGVTDSHHGHELLDDSSCGLQEEADKDIDSERERAL